MEYSQEAVTMVWSVSLLVGAVVIVVVAILLGQILKTAKQIEGGASAIWTQGKLVANNTIHIPMFLSTTNRVAGEILNTAVNVLNGSKVVEKHIDGCPGCPDCLLSKK